MAVSTRTLRSPRAVLGLARPGRSVRGFAIGWLLGILIAVLGLVALRFAYDGRIVPGVQAGGVDLSGMTPAAANDALRSALGPLEQGTVSVETPRGTLTIPYETAGRTVEVDAMVAAAFGHGRGSTGFNEALAILQGLRAIEPTTVPTVIHVDHAAIRTELAAFSERAYRGPISARIIPDEAGFALVRAVPGVAVDATAIGPDIEAALLDPTTTASTLTYAVTGTVVPPRTTDSQAVVARTDALRASAPLALTNGKKDWTIKPERIRTWITFAGVGASYAPVVDPAAIPAALKKVGKDVKVKPREATYLKTRSGKIFGVRASKNGRGLDVEETTSRIMAAMSARVAGTPDPAPVEIKTAAIAPELTTDEAGQTAPVVSRIGTWTTYYQAGPRNGNSANIVVPARRLNGQVIRPGQSFEFWSALGEVSFRTGYRLGAAIIGGRTVQDRALAGGICAVSTTLFNAAARAGLEIQARRPHYYYISRYPLGLDATVSDAITMRFRNDTSNPILIQASASGSHVRFELWSLPTGRTVSWSKPIVTNVVPGRDSTQLTSSLPTGQRERIEYPVDGMDVSVTRTVRAADGDLIHRDTFVSHYKRMIGVVLVGR